MSGASLKVLKAALAAMHATRIDRLAAPMTQGAGVIFMLHQVTPEPVQGFEPNRILKVTPSFLNDVIEETRRAGFDIVAIDDVKTRLADGTDGGGKPFAVFTLDDGYRDNRDFALPIFERHGVPCTVYVPSDFADGTGDLWWLVLQESIRRVTSVPLDIFGLDGQAPAASDSEKDAAFKTVYWSLRTRCEREARAAVSKLAHHAGFDAAALCRDLIMDWDELAAFAAHPLVTIGAHTKAHFAVSHLSDADARAEMTIGRARLEERLGTTCRHFSYPYGSEIAAGPRDFKIAAELGFETAVTTRKGMIHRHHANEMTALPRLSLNGDFQDIRMVRVLMSGAPFALLDAARRLRSGLKGGPAVPVSPASASMR